MKSHPPAEEGTLLFLILEILYFKYEANSLNFSKKWGSPGNGLKGFTSFSVVLNRNLELSIEKSNVVSNACYIY